MPRTAPVLLALAFVSGCSSAPPPPPSTPAGQSYPEAIHVICNVDRLAGVMADDVAIALGLKRTAWIAEHVDNADGIELRTFLSVKAATDQAAMIRVQAREAGVAPCPLADSLERDGVGGLSP